MSNVVSKIALTGKIFTDADHEDFCGVEPVTHPPEIPETRPLLNVNVYKENYLLAVMKSK